MIKIEKIDYHGWPNSRRLANDHLELVVTTDVGPRLIHFGFIDQENEFVTVADTLGKSGGSEWRLYGGHRFWHAPEHPQRTYYPDNEPVAFEDLGDAVRLTQQTESTTGIQKEIDIQLDPFDDRVQVTHRLINHNMWAVELAPWALSVMAPGGTGILPLPPRKAHQESLLPANTLAMWSYTDMADPRWTWGKRVILLRQDPQNHAPQKIGSSGLEGWLAYARLGHLFVKFFDRLPGARYPDLNSSVELFTNEMNLEVETLGPLTKISPGSAVSHTETWFLLSGIPQPQSEAEVTANIFPRIEQLRINHFQ